MTMSDFNLWTWNSRAFPGIDHLVVRKDRVRAHGQSHHDQPPHPCGYHFEVTGTDGGWVP